MAAIKWVKTDVGSSAAMNTQVPMPERIARLPRDRRGYPIPVIVTYDTQGLPLFTVNDSAVHRKCVNKKLCAICGERLTKELWFAGGPQSALHPHGMYFDSAMHHECVTYAMQVCPYLGTSRFHGLSDATRTKLQGRMAVPLVDVTVIPEKPELFVVVMAYGQSVQASSEEPTLRYIKPLRPYHAVEYWQTGKQLSAAEGLAMIEKIPELDLSALRLVR